MNSLPKVLDQRSMGGDPVNIISCSSLSLLNQHYNIVFLGVLSGPINIINPAGILPGQAVITNQQGNVSLTTGGNQMTTTTGIAPARFAQLMTMGLAKNQGGQIRAASSGSQNQLSLLVSTL